MSVNFKDHPFGNTLAELGEKYPNLVVVDADLQRATETYFFQEKFPNRYFDVGIAEANMVGISAGLALAGKTVFCGTFSTFISQRVCDQVVVSVAYSRANVKLMGVEPGIASGRNGASHQALLDIAIMRAIPGMEVYEPADAVETSSIMRYLAQSSSPAYMRVPRGKVPIIFNPDTYNFKPSKLYQLTPGTDAAIIASGIIIPEAIIAEKKLREKGLHVRVLNMSSIKPVDREQIIRIAEETGRIVVAENHSIHGGAGSLVAEILSEALPVPMRILGIKDKFGEVGPNDWLLTHFELDADHIAAAVLDLVEPSKPRLGV